MNGRVSKHLRKYAHLLATVQAEDIKQYTALKNANYRGLKFLWTTKKITCEKVREAIKTLEGK